MTDHQLSQLSGHAGVNAADGAPKITYGLPVELLNLGVERLGAVSAGLAGTLAVIVAMHEIADALGWGELALALVGGNRGIVGVGLLISLSFGMFFLTRTDHVRRQTVLDLGLLYAVICAFGIAMLENLVVWPQTGGIRGISWVCLWIIIFPVVVPATPGKTVLTVVLGAAMGPLAFGIAILTGKPPPSTVTAVALFAPNFAAVMVASITARVMYKLGTDVARARQMGNYELVECLGKGGMGEVWRAQHRRLARQAAVKFVRTDLQLGGTAHDTHGMSRRFEREAHATAMLRSPHTVQLYDFGITADNTVYYVMELLQGLDLETLVKQHGPMSPGRAVHLLTQACDSLAEAHRLGLIHRDIKPANLFTCWLGNQADFLKVLDFGLVRPTSSGIDSVENLTADGLVAGTPAYMSPEMAFREKDIDHRVDIYALGCVAYWILTGQRVFEADSPLGVLLCHAQDEPTPLSERTELAIPPDLEAVIMSCLEKDPADRPANAKALETRLLDCVIDEPWTAEHAERWWKANIPDRIADSRPTTRPPGRHRASSPDTAGA
ncbi:MAG: serine/threonine-protein kinase [Myxococcota bacterium]